MTDFTLPALPGALDTVYHVDALALLAALPEASVDCVVTDPPYGVGTQVSARRSPEFRFDEIEGADYINKEWIPDAYRILKDGSALYAFAKWTNFGEWQDLISSAGFTVKNCIVWDKLQHGTGDLLGAYAPQHELVIFASKGRHYLNGKRMPDVIRYPKVQPGLLTHPYEKPIGLLEMFIEASSNPSAVILDPFMGSGTTAVAARNLGRRFIGCDLSADYVAIANKRLSQPYTPSFMALLDAAQSPEPSATEAA